MIIKLIDNLLAGCERGFLLAANGLLLGMLAINLANILSRLLFNAGIIWVFPWTVVMFVWMIFLGFFVFYRRGQDIAIDVLVRRFGRQTRFFLNMLVSLLVAGFFALVVYQASILLPRQVGRIDLVGIQRYWLAIPFFISCSLISLQFVMHILVALRDARKPDFSLPGSPG